jgi:hypothetical protein
LVDVVLELYKKHVTSQAMPEEEGEGGQVQSPGQERKWQELMGWLSGTPEGAVGKQHHLDWASEYY